MSTDNSRRIFRIGLFAGVQVRHNHRPGSRRDPLFSCPRLCPGYINSPCGGIGVDRWVPAFETVSKLR